MYPFLFPHTAYAIPTYVLIISLIYCFAPFWILKRAEKKNLKKATALDICLAVMIGGLIGARLMHVYYEMPEFYRLNHSEIVKIWEGGFVFYGGFLGAIIFVFLLLRFRRENFLEWADVFAPVFALGYGFGRIGCFLAGCCYGMTCKLPWAVHFPPGGEAPPGVALHPTQLYAASWEFALLAVLIYFERYLQKVSYNFHKNGLLFFIWLFFHGSGRIIMELFRDDPRGPTPLGFSISTWISAGLMLLSAFFILSCFIFGKGKKYVSSAV